MSIRGHTRFADAIIAALRSMRMGSCKSGGWKMDRSEARKRPNISGNTNQSNNARELYEDDIDIDGNNRVAAVDVRTGSGPATGATARSAERGKGAGEKEKASFSARHG